MNSKEWKEISDVILLGYEQIRPHLNQLETHKGIRSISEALGITKRRATRLTAYLVYYGLVDPSICGRFIPGDVPTDIADKFRHIDQLDGKQDDLAKEVYGWNLFEYFYFRSSPEVMHYLYLESKRDQKKSKYKKGEARSIWEEKLTGYLEACEQQGVFPTTKTASEAIGCSQSLLRSGGLLSLISTTQQKITPVYEEQLKKRVEEYLWITPANEVTRKNCISSLGTTRHTLKRNYPMFYAWFQGRLDQHIEQSRFEKYNDIIQRFPDIMNQLATSGESITQDNVCSMLGISKSQLLRISELREAYREAAATALFDEKERGDLE